MFRFKPENPHQEKKNPESDRPIIKEGGGAYSPYGKERKDERTNKEINERLEDSENSRAGVEDDQLMEEFEYKNDLRKGNAFIPIEDLPDYTDLSEDEWYEKISEIANADDSEDEVTELVSRNKLWLPYAHHQVLKNNFVPGNKWRRLSQDEKRKHRQKVQRLIEESYVKNKSAKMVLKKNNKDVEKAA
ncbi:MAG: hypothetical protein NUV82_01765 [Candidatus Komeilibacteria bacterium]|nr:hypothetical protein [Candidatus Komeilibacteria bacterium]